MGIPSAANLTPQDFSALPLVIRGESKEVRYLGGGWVAIDLLPTIYSFTANRADVVPGTEELRRRASKVFAHVLQEAGVRHAYREVNGRYILSELLLHPASPLTPDPFRPEDLSESEVNSLRWAPPIEVVIKAMHSGTSKHRYHGMAGFPIREDHPLYPRVTFEAEGAYPQPVVRFDWRNPLRSSKGDRLADEVLGDAVADWYINTEKARQTALRVYEVLSDFLNTRDIVLYDLCLFISADGETVFGEISQDCGRFRHFDLGSLDKDVWRSGGSSDLVKQKWQLLLELIE